MLEQVFLKGGFSGFGGVGVGLTPILQIIPFIVMAMVLLMIYSIFEQMMGGSGIRIRFWKKKKRLSSSSESL